ncbi:dolichol-phosphate mannosyltransferase [Cutibacterium acnes JCM 18909]|nr:dolichol-phosphate mannosyltransferase [Cutibacterium acnes JCM 18909]
MQPDIVNVHYATGYGLLARLAHIDAPTLLSVWGSDVYDSPRVNPSCVTWSDPTWSQLLGSHRQATAWRVSRVTW